MNNKHLFAAALAASVSFTSAFAGGEGWGHDFEAAKKQAASEKKDLLMDFTGSDWCGWCIKLNKEVFSHDPFKEGVKDKFVLVEFDYPNDKSKLDEATIKQNEVLKDKYAIQGYPTILLCDFEGKPFAATGYQDGGPEKYVKHLDELRAKRETRDKAFADAAKQEGPAQAKALIAALGALELEDATIASFYSDVVAKIKAADPKDETGYVKKAEEGAKFAKFDAELRGFFEKGEDEESMKKAMGEALVMVEKTVADNTFSGENKQKVLLAKVSILANSGKFDDAIKAVDEAKAAAPDSELAPRMDGFKERLAEAKNQKKGAAEEEKETEDQTDKTEDKADKE